MEDILLEEFPWIPIYQPISSFAMAKDIEWKPQPSSSADFRKGNLSFKA